MPEPIVCQSTHIEGENVRTLGRVVGLDQVMLDQESAGDLTITIMRNGRALYTKTILAGSTTGILAAPTKPLEWTLRGYVNFDYTHDVDALAAESPPFAFQGGNSYTIVYDFDTPDHGHVFGHHVARFR